jgi:hypothetical protein
MRPFAAIGQRFGLGVSDGLRPGGITSSGNVSLHATGDAIDVSGSPAGMMGYFKFLRSRFGSRLDELIYTPGRIGIKNGQLTPIPGPIYDAEVAADHRDHVHVGFTGGSGDGTGHARKARTGDGVGRRKIVAIADAAKAFGISPAILWGVYGAETNFGRIKSNSSAGAQGPFQFMPATARAYGVNPHNFFSAVRGAAKYLSQYKSRGVAGMLAAYNAGPAGNPNNSETRAYIPKVIRLSKTWPGVTSRGGGGGGGGGGGSGGGGGGGNTGPVVERDKGTTSLGAIPRGPGASLGPAGELVRAETQEARARASDNLKKLIKSRQRQINLKQSRLNLIRKVMKRKLRKARRLRLLQEEAQLVEEIDALAESLTEYRADQAAGATTVTRAEELEAGVDPNIDTETPVVDTSAQDAANAAAEADRQLKEAIAALTKELADTRAFGERVQATENFQLKKYLADVISGQIGGYGVVGRSFTPGTGVEYAY